MVEYDKTLYLIEKVRPQKKIGIRLETPSTSQ